LSREAFKFWNTLDKQSKQSGELYETQPAQIQGNIHPQDEGGEPVLGLFYATSVTEKRIFVSPVIATWKPDCELYGLTGPELMDLLSTYGPHEYPVYLYFEDLGFSKIFDYANQLCFDCRLRGGTTERPDFWE
jgi:hypothetical protein